MSQRPQRSKKASTRAIEAQDQAAVGPSPKRRRKQKQSAPAPATQLLAPAPGPSVRPSAHQQPPPPTTSARDLVSQSLSPESSSLAIANAQAPSLGTPPPSTVAAQPNASPTSSSSSAGPQSSNSLQYSSPLLAAGALSARLNQMSSHLQDNDPIVIDSLNQVVMDPSGRQPVQRRIYSILDDQDHDQDAEEEHPAAAGAVNKESRSYFRWDNEGPDGCLRKALSIAADYCPFGQPQEEAARRWNTILWKCQTLGGDNWPRLKERNLKKTISSHLTNYQVRKEFNQLQSHPTSLDSLLARLDAEQTNAKAEKNAPAAKRASQSSFLSAASLKTLKDKYHEARAADQLDPGRASSSSAAQAAAEALDKSRNRPTGKRGCLSEIKDMLTQPADDRMVRVVESVVQMSNQVLASQQQLLASQAQQQQQQALQNQQMMTLFARLLPKTDINELQNKH